MSPVARAYCNLAIVDIGLGNHEEAIDWLRFALRQTSDRKAWSKIMLAIRELGRIVKRQ